MEKRYVIVRGQVCDWEEKAPFVTSGKSVQGAMEYDRHNDGLKCHECGEWYTSVGAHARKAHAISSRTYKERHGLRYATSLLAPLARLKRSERSRAYKPPIHGRRRGSLPGEVGNFRNNFELQNERNTCAAQLVRRMQKIAADIGRTPNKKELIAGGINSAATHRFGVGYVEHFRELAGLAKPARKPRDARFSKAILVEVIRDFYVLNKRLPTHKEMGSRGLMPNETTFRKYFGSMQAACAEAGLSYVWDHRQGKMLSMSGLHQATA